MISWCRAVESFKHPFKIKVEGEIADFTSSEKVGMVYVVRLKELYPGLISDQVYAKSWDKISGNLFFTFNLPIDKAQEFVDLDIGGEFIGKLDKDVDVRFSYFYNGKESTADQLWSDLRNGIDIEG